MRSGLCKLKIFLVYGKKKLHEYKVTIQKTSKNNYNKEVEAFIHPIR